MVGFGGGGWLSWYGSAPAYYGSSLGSNPDISQKYKMGDVTAKEWPTHPSSPKNIQNKTFFYAFSEYELRMKAKRQAEEAQRAPQFVMVDEYRLEDEPDIDYDESPPFELAEERPSSPSGLNRRVVHTPSPYASPTLSSSPVFSRQSQTAPSSQSSPRPKSFLFKKPGTIGSSASNTSSIKSSAAVTPGGGFSASSSSSGSAARDGSHRDNFGESL